MDLYLPLCARWSHIATIDILLAGRVQAESEEGAAEAGEQELFLDYVCLTDELVRLAVNTQGSVMPFHLATLLFTYVHCMSACGPNALLPLSLSRELECRVHCASTPYAVATPDRHAVVMMKRMVAASVAHKFCLSCTFFPHRLMFNVASFQRLAPAYLVAPTDPAARVWPPYLAKWVWQGRLWIA